MPISSKALLASLLGSTMLIACSADTNNTNTKTADMADWAYSDLPAGGVVMDLDSWPTADIPTRPGYDAEVENRVDAILADMTIEQKVGQILQPEITHVSPEEVRDYHLGSVLNGGNGRPNRDIYASAEDWIDLADQYYTMSMDDTQGGIAIPIIWGTDSVHGNNSIFGGTIFPHNMGLGNANNPELMKQVGRVTAVETAAMGVDWTFAPAVSVARDDSWGRTYESYSEDAQISARVGSAYVLGLQGDPTDPDAFFPAGSIVGTAKHFIADGGTQNGRDQGDAVISEAELRDIHMPPYITTLEAGVQTVMASYSKWNGVRMHGHGPLLTGVLKDRAGFDGFVVGDFNGHALIPGCTNGDCPEALIAGVDMYMIPKDWKELYGSLVSQAKDGTIPMERLDDAVRRILRVKIRAGLMEAGKPSSRPFAGSEFVGTPEHKTIARQAARESVVLLKNDNAALPLAPGTNILVAGQNAHDLPALVGGWSLNWQGSGLTNKDFPQGASAFVAIKQAATKGGGTATLNVAGNYKTKPDAAVVIFGEKPYAEYQGDRESVLYSLPENDPDLKVMRKLQADGIPVIAVFVSGRPMWVNAHLNSSDAFIAAFLPGTEGGRALADLIVQDRDAPKYDFTGRLAFSWPKLATQTRLNKEDEGYDPLFALGFGLSLTDAPKAVSYDENPGLSDTLLAAAESSVFFEDGRTLAPWRIYLGDQKEGRLKTEGDRFVTSPNGAVSFDSFDKARQEDSKKMSFSGKETASAFVLGYSTVDFTRRLDEGQALRVSGAVMKAPTADVTLTMASRKDSGSVDITDSLKDMPQGEYSHISVSLSCFAKDGVDFARVISPAKFETSGEFEFILTDIRLAEADAQTLSCD